LVGAGEADCAQCGAPLAGPAVQEGARPSVYDREAMRFARAVLSRPSTFTIIFLIANLFVFMLMWSSSGLKNTALMEFSYPVLIAYGAKLNSLIDARPHQWWRFVTPIFIHVNLIHLMVNMYSLWMIGPYVEKLYGSAKFVVFWVVTGIAGVMASYLTVRPDMQVSSLWRFLFKAADSPSAGASGALFGLVGVLFVFGIKFRHELPEGFKRAFGTGLLPMILLNLFIGYLGRGFIDNAAHLGGLVSGAALALVVGYKRPGEPASVAVFWHVLQIAALILVAASFLMVVRHFHDKPPTPLQELSDEQMSERADVEAYFNAINAGQQAFVIAMNDGDYSTIEDAIRGLGDAPSLDDKADSLRKQLIHLLAGTRELAQMKPEERQGPRARQQRTALLEDFEAWSRNFKDLIKTDGEKYGVTMREEQHVPEDAQPQEK
jgi:membrane associated rhomboid family serine protease